MSLNPRRTATFLLMLMLMFTTIALCMADSPWPMRGHDVRHTGQSPYKGPDIAGVKWKFQTGAAVGSSPCIGSDGTVYVGSVDNHLYAINPDGTLRWKFKTGGWVSSSPCIGSDGTVYVGSYDNHLYAINPDGALRWKFKTGNGVYSSPCIGSDGTVCVGSRDSYLYAINPDGSLKWKFQIGFGFYSVYSSPCIGSDGTVYVGSEDNHLYAINPDGSLKWKFQIGFGFYSVSSSPCIGSDGTVYVGSADHYLYAVKPDGALRWKFNTDSLVSSSPCIGLDGTVYVGSYDHYLYAINPDGALRWKFQTGNAVDSSPCIGSDGTVYVGSVDNHLYAISPDGALRWKFQTGDRVSSSPCIGSDGMLYVGSNDSIVYALRKAAGPVNVPPSTAWVDVTRHFIYADFASVGRGADAHGIYEKYTVVQLGYCWKGKLGLEGALVDVVRFKDSRGIYSWLPLGVYRPIYTINRSVSLNSGGEIPLTSVINFIVRIHPFPKYDHNEDDDTPLPSIIEFWSVPGKTSFPIFLDACFEWRSTIHTISIGARFQVKRFKHETEGWARDLNMTGLFANARIGFSITLAGNQQEQKSQKKPQLYCKAVVLGLPPDGILYGGKTAQLQITVENKGDGTARDVSLSVGFSENKQSYFTFTRPDVIKKLGKSKREVIEFPISVSENVPTGTVKLIVNGRDKSGYSFSTEPIELQIRNVIDPRLHYEKGITAFNLERYYEAAKEFNMAVIIKPDYQDALSKLKEIPAAQAKGYMDKAIDASLKQDYVESIRFMLKAVAVNPYKSDYRRQLKSEYAKGIAHLKETPDKASQLSTEAAAWESLDEGIGYLASGNLSRAEEKMREAIRRDSGYAIAHLFLGIVLVKKGTVSQAQAAFAKAIELDGEIEIPADIGSDIWKIFLALKGESMQDIR